MGKEFVVNSLEELCDLMCNNIVPDRKNNCQYSDTCKYDQKTSYGTESIECKNENCKRKVIK